MHVAIMAMLASLAVASASAEERVPVRTGSHAGHGRLVFGWSIAPAYQVEQDGTRVLLRFPRAEALDLPGPRRLPRNVLAIDREGETVTLRVAPGTSIRHFRNGSQVALDVMDPPAPAAAPVGQPRRPIPPPAEAPGAAHSARSSRSPGRASAQGQAQPGPVAPDKASSASVNDPEATPRPPPVVPAPIAAAPPVILPPQAPVVAAPPVILPPQALAAPVPPEAPRSRAVAERPRSASPGPDSIQAIPLSRDAARPELRLRQSGTAGLAVFRRGARILMVLDEERGLDLTRLANHPAWHEAEATPLPGGALLSWPAAGLVPELRRDGADWVLGMRPAAEAAATALRLQHEAGQGVAAAPSASRVVTLADPESGLPLLVGTLRETGPRQAVTRALAEFDLLETSLGLVLLARADQVTMRAGPARFVIGSDAGAVAMTEEPAAQLLGASSMTRSFDLPFQPVSHLLERLRSARLQVAEAAPLTRAAPRLAAAEALLALGLPQEAQAMLGLAAREVPEAAQDARHRALATMAALLAGRAGEEPAGFDDALPPSDELTLWRSVQAANRGDARAAAPGFAATMPLLLAYPEPLRRRLLPLAAEAMAAGDEPAAARSLIEQTAGEPGLRFAQAMLDEAAGDTDRALEGLDALIGGRDRRQRARAMRRAAELRLAAGRTDAADAARALERSLHAWRGDEDEFANRSRIAELRLQAGDARGAMAMLRETEGAFPDQAAQLRPALQASFLAALRNEPPLGAVALHDSQPGLLPANSVGEEALAVLAERLGKLDIPDRAAALLRGAMERMPVGEARAALGLRLAAQRLAERDAEGALAALGASSAAGLTPGLDLERSLLAAQAEARRGRREAAVDALALLGPAGDETLAEILAEARDFAGAAAALSRHLAAVTPAQGPLPESTQRVALRVVALLAMAGDDRGIGALRRSHGPRMQDPAHASAFEALTADPVRGLADLPRLARELNLFRGLPQMREPLRTAALPTG